MTEKVFSKNFTLLILGQVSSLFGNYIIKFALSMYVLGTTGSVTIFTLLPTVPPLPCLTVMCRY